MAESQRIDWSRFLVEMPLNMDALLVEEAWTTRRGIEGWFLRAAIYRDKQGSIREAGERVQPGDTYAWRWHGWPDSMEEYGEVLATGPGEFFRFVFGKAGIVSVGLYEKEGEKILWLKQEGIPSDEAGKYNWHVGCKTGWTFYLANLKSILMGGPDLRNKNMALNMD